MKKFEEGTIWISTTGAYSLEMEGILLHFTGAEIREEAGEITFYRNEKPCAVIKTEHLSKEIIDKIKSYVREEE